MDEKAMVSVNALNRALEKQIVKRTDAPAPTPEAAAKNLAVVTATESGQFAEFFEAWDAYYPRIVSLLGWASWFMPGKSVTIIKSLLAVVNNNIIPILRELAKKG